jgi:Arc/MetJ-type ribon-helix-helix transcriptional regulator
LENTKINKGKHTLAKPAFRTPTKGVAATKLAKKGTGKNAKKTNDKLEHKIKVIRDSFTMPQSDYSKLGELKLVCQKAGLYVKKSELLRAGLQLLGKLSTAQLKKTIAQIEQIKTGRPKGS